MTHYSHAQMPKELFETAKVAADILFEEFFIKKPEYVEPVLCYSGMSGVSAATAISYFLFKELTTREVQDHAAFSMLYVRKPNEESHGRHVEYDIIYSKMSGWRPKQFALVFVDDFICSGATRDYTLNNALEYLQQIPESAYELELMYKYFRLSSFSQPQDNYRA